LLVPDQQSPGICRRVNDWPHPNVTALVETALAFLERRLLYNQMLAIYPERVNPAVLWLSARAMKPGT
jgi:hypothetical protein